ncbi:MAG: hypothetical protein AB8H86_06860 [Polyangiales bacterium]
MFGVMRALVLCLFFLVACGSCGNEWPLSVHVDGDYEVSGVLTFPGEQPDELRPLSLPPGEHGAAELIFHPMDTDPLVLVDLSGGARWVRMASPLAEVQTRFLRGLGAEVRVSFFEDGDRAIVVVDGTTKAVQCSAERVRVLDHNTAVLEGCRMSGGRRRYECNLDMMWASAEFDADGEELTGNWAPAWR